jgi:hypothetical protein
MISSLTSSTATIQLSRTVLTVSSPDNAPASGGSAAVLVPDTVSISDQGRQLAQAAAAVDPYADGDGD